MRVLKIISLLAIVAILFCIIICCSIYVLCDDKGNINSGNGVIILPFNYCLFYNENDCTIGKYNSYALEINNIKYDFYTIDENECFTAKQVDNNFFSTDKRYTNLLATI